MASNGAIEPIENDIEDSFDAPESNCIDYYPSVILVLFLFFILYALVRAILENSKANEPPYKL